MRLLAFCCWLLLATPPAAESQEPSSEPSELSSLRALLEQQTRQLNSLQDRVLRLQEMIALLLARPTTSAASPSANPAAPTTISSSVDSGSAQPATAPPLPAAPSTSGPAPTPGTTSPHLPSPLSPPEASQPAVHVPQHLVEKGQTLISIARQHGVSVSDLQKLNKIEDVKKLQVGQRLLLPSAAPGQKAP
jgi:LysM repeat protein